MTDNFNRFLRDAVGVLRFKGNPLGNLMKKKRWVPVFLLLVIAVCLYTYITAPMQLAKMAGDSPVTELLPEEQTAYFVNDSLFTRLMACITAAFSLTLSLIFGAFFVYLFFGIGGSKGVYANYFSLVVNASIIDVLLPTILNAISLLLNTDIFHLFINPGLYLFPPAPGSFVYLLMMRMDLFAIWYTAAIAAGITLFSGMRFNKSMGISLLYFLFKLIVGTAFSYLLIKLAGAPM